MSADVIIYHNPDMRHLSQRARDDPQAGIKPHVIEYLKTPPSRRMLESLIVRAGLTPRELLRGKGTPYAELGLDDPDLTDAQLVDARWSIRS